MKPIRFSLSLDPRTGLILTLLFSGMIILFQKLVWLIVGLGTLFALILLAGNTRAFIRWLRFIAPMTLFWFGISWWAFDPATALKAGLRLLTLTAAFFVYFRTTTPEDLGNALLKCGVPFEFAFIMSTSLNFVPFISRKIQNIVDAQRARGIPLEPAFSAIRHYPKLFVPLLVQAFEAANQLAEALEARGFGRAGRSFHREYKLRLHDWGAILGGGSLFIGLILMRILKM